MLRTKLFGLLALLGSFAAQAQQVPKAGTITVAQDGSGNFRTVQEAADLPPAHTPVSSLFDDREDETPNRTK